MAHTLTKLKSRWQTVKQAFLDYASNSTIHGVSYIAEKERSLFEKVWWIVVFCLSVFCCCKLILIAWNISPFIISFAEKPTPIWQIPFPTVTICSRTFARSDRISITDLIYAELDYEELYTTFPEEEQYLTLAKQLFCLDKAELVSDLSNITTCNGCVEDLQKILIPVEELLVKCKFRNQVIDCQKSFIQTIVNGRVCYTFNELGFKRYNPEELDATNEAWGIDGGYEPTAPFDAYPHRALGAGQKFGFSVLLRSDKRYFDRLCSMFDGFVLELRMPYESPQFSDSSFSIPMGKSFQLTLTPKMMTTSDQVRSYSPTQRNCYFSNELRLKYFKQYTLSNCEIECLADAILKNCGCLPIAIETKVNQDICGPARFDCMIGSTTSVYSQHFSQCNCLPACTKISFDSEESMTVLNKSTLRNFVEDQREEYEHSEVKIFFKTNHFLTQTRKERYGTIEFLANCGGLLGLCLGVSVLSFLEITYFCTLRLWFPKQGCEVISVVELQRNRRQTHRYLKMVKELLRDYFNKTTIQGVKYAAEASLTVLERLWWTIIIFISMLACGSLIFHVLERHDRSPVIISFANQETPVSQIPFPAVTICPQYITKDVPEMFGYFKERNLSLYALGKQGIERASAVAQVCDSDIFSDIDSENRSNCEGCAAYLKRNMCNDNQCFSYCTHIYGWEECLDIFEQVVTAGGVCYAYNSMSIFRILQENSDDITDNWTLEGGYINYTGHTDVHPRSGSKSSLVVVLHAFDKLLDDICKGVQGYKVYLHLPVEAPQISKHFYMMPFFYSTKFYITPKVINTAPELRGFSVATRQCYFSDERYLRFFRHYTQNNCESECLVNITMSRCNCLMFYMPKIPGAKFCGISDVKCHQSVIRQTAEGNIKKSQSSSCDCLPTCTSISYDTEISHIRLPADFVTSEMYVSFRDTQFVALERSQLFGMTEILANCGGLLGLFLGFSIISILELIYFCTIRLFCNWRFELFR